jgi:hypothetical protein
MIASSWAQKTAAVATYGNQRIVPAMSLKRQFAFADVLRSDRNIAVPTRDFLDPTPQEEKVVFDVCRRCAFRL